MNAFPLGQTGASGPGRAIHAASGGLPAQRILHVFRAPVGGLFRHVVDLARLQAAAGHEVGIVCDASTGGERAAQALAELAPCLVARHHAPADAAQPASLRPRRRCAPSPGAPRPSGPRPARARGQGRRLCPHGRRCPARAPIRAYTPHGGSYNYKPGTLRHRFYMGLERLMRPAHRRVPVRERVRRRAAPGLCRRDRAASPASSTTASARPNSRRSCRPPDPLDLVYIGELRDAKGVPFLLDALLRLRAAGRPLRLLMVGSGPDAERSWPSASWRWASATPWPSSRRRRSARCWPAAGSWWCPPSPNPCPTWCWRRPPPASPSSPPMSAASRRSSGPPRPTWCRPATGRRWREAIARVLDEEPEACRQRFETLAASVRARLLDDAHGRRRALRLRRGPARPGCPAPATPSRPRLRRRAP